MAFFGGVGACSLAIVTQHNYVNDCSIYRRPSEHFCGSQAATHQPLVQDHHHHQQLHVPSLKQELHSATHHYQKHSGGADADELGSKLNGEKKDRLKRQTSTAIKDSCPMELVATHRFVEVYGREGVADVIQFMVSCDVT